MSSNQLYKDLESLIDNKSSKYNNNSKLKLAYERGYLMGVLLRLSINDSYTASFIRKMLRSQDNKR